MERSIRIRLDTEKIKTLDAIYISHAHTDHFDPYTLMEIYGAKIPFVKEGKGDFVSENSEQDIQSSHLLQTAPLQTSLQRPLLILPVSLSYLLPLIHEYLGDIPVHILFPKKTFLLK